MGVLFGAAAIVETVILNSFVEYSTAERVDTFVFLIFGIAWFLSQIVFGVQGFYFLRRKAKRKLEIFSPFETAQSKTIPVRYYHPATMAKMPKC